MPNCCNNSSAFMLLKNLKSKAANAYQRSWFPFSYPRRLLKISPNL